MKKKQFKRLEHLLTTLVESSIGNGTELHRIKADARQIAQTHAEGGAAILEAMGTLENGNVIIHRSIEQGHEGTLQTTKAIEALSRNLDMWLSKHKDQSTTQHKETLQSLKRVVEWVGQQNDHGSESMRLLANIESLLDSDDQMAGLNAIAGFGEEQARSLEAMVNKLVDLHTCMDAWGKVAQEGNDRMWNTTDALLNSIDTQMAPVSHASAKWSRAQVRSGPGLEEFTAGGTDIPEPSAPEGPDPTTADSWGGKLGEDLPADYRLSDAVRESEADLLAIQKEAVGRFENSVMDQWDKSKAKLEETEERLKLALEDLGGHKEGLPQDASMDRFIKWVGDHGWTWIMGHRASINERLDRMEREAAYNRGNATVQDVTTTEDRGVTTSTLGKPRVIKDNPQA